MAGPSGQYVALIADSFDEHRMKLARGVRTVLAAHGMALLVYIDDPFEPGLSIALASMLWHAPPRGVIITPCSMAAPEEELSNLLAELSIPAAHIGLPGTGPAYVRDDNEAGIRELMAHLLDQRGVRRPALIRGGPGQWDAIEREAAIRRELDRRGLVLDEALVIDGDSTLDSASAGMRDLLITGRTMDAVIALNDPSAVGAWRALTERRLRVPEDVLVTGFDNENIAFMNWPGLTTVEPNAASQGAAAANYLLAQFHREPVGGDSRAAPQLIVRASTGVGHQSVEHERDAAISVARAAQVQLAEQSYLLGLNQALMRCRTIADMIEALSSTHLSQLGIGRCVLALYESDDGQPAHTATSESRARLLLDYRAGTAQPAPRGPFPLHELLDHALQHWLGDAVLVFQPLSVAGRHLGYILFEHLHTGTDSADDAHWSGALTEMLRIDLSRTLSGVLGTQELENQVAQRTRELQAEVGTRRQAEAHLERMNSELERSVMQDSLTRIPNRAAFQRHLQLYVQTAPTGQELALLFIDVDHFKTYNDHYGHLMGDAALCTVASCLSRAVLYPQDLACRWGGEEFAVVLPASGAEGATAVAERFFELLAAAAIPHAASTVSSLLTVSIGMAVTTSSPDLNTGDLIEYADEALYAAKALGRNRIERRDPLPWPVRAPGPMADAPPALHPFTGSAG